MKIGIDIDDTTFLTVNSILKYADLFEEEREGILVTDDNFNMIHNYYFLKDLYGWDDKIKSDFFNKYYKNILEECTMIPHANEVINKLREEGNTIHFITARVIDTYGCEAEAITKNSLKKFGILYDSLNFQVSDKYSFVEENDIDLLIDDNYDTCHELVSKGKKALLMSAKTNENIDDPNIIKVNGWDEIYAIIHKMF